MTLSNPSPGHDPALPDVTSVMRLFREHEAMIARANAGPGGEECDRLCDLACAIADRIAQELATTMADLAVKVLILTNIESDSEYEWEASVARDCEANLPGGAA